MQPTTYAQALDEWLDGQYDLPTEKQCEQLADDLFEVDTPVTYHASARAAQRGIASAVLPLLAVSGRTFPARDGCIFTYVSEQEARETGCPSLANLAAIISPDGVIVTTYRMAHPPRERNQRPSRQRAFLSRQRQRAGGGINATR